jgi:FkbM family methyltransferase
MHMLKQIVKNIRRNTGINRVVRNRLQNLHANVQKLVSYWPPVGVVDLKFDNIEFQAFSNADDHIINDLFYNRSYHETKDLRCFSQLAKHSSCIFDIGANTGIYSILSSLINPAASIYSFEPFSSNVERLKKNISLNKTNNIKIVTTALGDKEDIINFTVPEGDNISDTSSAIDGFSEHTYGGSLKWKTIQVPQTSLDKFVSENYLTGIDLIKIDVEGYEMMVFKGGINTFQNFNPVIQCEIFVNEERKNFFNNFIKESGYTVYTIIGEGILRLDDGLIMDAQILNFLFSKKRLDSIYTPFSRVFELM